MANMKNHENRLRRHAVAIFFCLGMLMGNFHASAGDNAALISVSVPPGTQIMPRTMFTQTWTFQNTGTTTWSPTYSGYTLNIIGEDTLGAVPLTNKPYVSSYPSASIDSGKSVAPGTQTTFTMDFIAPEVPGSYTDTFQLNSSSSVFFGPQVTVQITVPKASSTNQYDRARAVSYANNYSGYVNSDGYFWTNGDYPDFGAYPPLSPAPPSGLGDDCAHFVSCCIGSEPHVRGGGLPIPSRTLPTYGEPGAGRLIYTVLVGGGYATEVSSLSSMEPGDLVGWNWHGVTNADAADINHVTIYLGNGLLASHSASDLEVSATTWYNGVHHYIHIFDAPTIIASQVGKNLVLSWGTNWTGYVLYSSTNLSAGATWTKVSKSPVKIGEFNVMTNTVTSGAVFYRLTLP
jgi:cell wall-associated NlpC family hydrolase